MLSIMKNIIRIKIVFLLSLLLSCTNLKEDPIGILTPSTLYTRPLEIEGVNKGSYLNLTAQLAYGRQLSFLFFLRSDLIFPTANAERFAINDFSVVATNSLVRDGYQKLFEIVSASNQAIFYATALNAVSPQVRDQLVGEAKFLRAFAYYQLVRLWGRVPYITEASLSDQSDLTKVSRASVEDIYAGIVADLKVAQNTLPAQWPDKLRTRGTAGAATGLLSSVYLTQGNYAGAYTEAKKVIDAKATYDYDLMANYVDLFDAAKSDGLKEHLFAIDFFFQGNTLNNDDILCAHLKPLTPTPAGTTYTSGIGNVAASPVIKSDAVWSNADRRKNTITAYNNLYIGGNGRILVDANGGVPVGTAATVTVPSNLTYVVGYNIFPGRVGPDGRDSDLNWGLLRYAEILLIAAEALIEQGGSLGEAAGYINLIRNRAGLPNTLAASQVDLRAALREERKWEFASEFSRWFDIKRWKLLDLPEATHPFGPNGLEPKANFASINWANQYDYPIPQVEVDLNPNLNK
jgi:starch-binding outer membrane protein, SusD/RagB family